MGDGRGAKVVLLSETWEAFAWVIDGLGESGVKKKTASKLRVLWGALLESSREMS